MVLRALLLLLLGAVARAGVVKEMIPGVYNQLDENKRTFIGFNINPCPPTITLGDFVPATGYASVSTDDATCTTSRIAPKAYTPPNANATLDGLSKIPRTILKKEELKSGTIITGALLEKISCTRNTTVTRSQRKYNSLPNNTALTFVKPLKSVELFGVVFNESSQYLLLKKRALKCMYAKLVPKSDTENGNSDNGSASANAATSTHAHPDGTPAHSHGTGTVKIALWAWLGPLIGGLLVCISLLACVLWKYRRDRWYPFNGNQDEDASDSEMFGRLSTQSPYKGNSNSFERAPSGIVFENSNESDPSDDNSNNNNNSSGNGNSMRV